MSLTKRSILILALLAASPVGAQTLTGPAWVSDGDTIRIEAEAIRLHGIDAPESRQECEGRDGHAWACGEWAREVLSELVENKTVRCEGIERDRYGRLVAKCHVDGMDIGEEMVARGAAHAYRKYSLDYVDAEKRAFVAAIGLWQGEHLPPDAYRAQRADAEQPVPASGCAIKGNISKSGRIYHVPGQHDYAATRIDEGKGERWFCSPQEAEAAGWRAARR
ncbi:thermonuclease family protein [Aliiruegeria sabulilitoris]|uniref:thermonuclease family protein n=1 Tax=Aliiruegeria sabulilitoris TaxID=1510458 RepID=UPI0008367E69|nr:thermonuclease family protein [Aliiruegeria sabulilitoris]NDR56002.1 thermonuclease family protein [Pseudoruegeria sp. M32A2M]